MNGKTPQIDSKIVDKSLRAIVWPVLKEVGFTRRNGRTTWRDRPGCIQTMNIQSFNSYLAEAMGATTFSFGVNVGVFYPVIAEHAGSGAFIKDLSRPAEYDCQARFHMAKGISQPNTERRRWFGARTPVAELGAWVDRPDVWYVRADGTNLDEVVADARDQVVTTGLPWLDRLADLAEARRKFLEDESTNHAPGIVAEHYGGALGSPARWHAVGALSVALGDPDGIEWATREMASMRYYQDQPADLDALRRASEPDKDWRVDSAR